MPRGNSLGGSAQGARAGMTGLVLLLAASTGTSCAWQAPGGGVPKGCVQETSYPQALQRGLGISSHVEWGADDPAASYRAFEVAAWQELGVGSVRTDLTWARLESERGTWDFAGTDRVVDATESAGSSLLAILDYGNSWANSSGDAAAPPDDVADFGTYAEAVAQRYAGRVEAYEVWNEQNIGLTFWHPTEDPEAYAELLVEAAARVRAADPEALVSFGGVFGPRLLLNTEGEAYIREVAAVLPELADTVDILAFHPYRYPFSAPELEDASQDSLLSDICSMRDLAEEIGGSHLRLWMTELGWHTALDAIAPGVSTETQGAYLARAALLSFSQGVERFYWYTFRDTGLDNDYQEDRFGLYSYDEDPSQPPSAQPVSALEFAALSRALGQHTTVRDRSEELGLDAETWALELSGGTGRTLAVWTTGDERTVLVEPRDQATLLDAAGAELALETLEGAWQIPASPRPHYLLSD